MDSLSSIPSCSHVSEIATTSAAVCCNNKSSSSNYGKGDLTLADKKLGNCNFVLARDAGFIFIKLNGFLDLLVLSITE
jgi:hypothetical protein